MNRIIKLLVFVFIITLFNNTIIYCDEFPYIQAESYIVIDKESGRILASKNPNKKLPMASVTKIATAITAIRNCDDYNTVIEIPSYCTNIEGSSLYLTPKDKVSLIDLLYGLMMRSGNDSALAIADYFGQSSIDTFLSMMNNLSKELGAYNTNFVNPHGLSNEKHYSTAYDLAVITQYALNNKIFKQIVSSETWFANSLERKLYNKNKVVWDYEYGTGVKIGYTRNAGRCISASAEKNGVETIIILLNDNNWFNDCYKIFDWAFANYEKYNIIQDKQLFFNGENVSGSAIVANDSFSYLLKPDEIKDLSIETVEMPFIENGNSKNYYGYYKVFLKEKLLYTGKLVYE